MPYISEDHKEIASGKKKDDEGYMARIELDNITKSVKRLKSTIKGSDHQLPAWVQSKITRAADYIDAAAEYLSSDEDLDEGLSFDINKTPKKRSVGKEKLLKMTPDQRNQLPQDMVKKVLGSEPQLPSIKKEELSLTERILKEMGCDCDMKPHKSVEKIAKKHNTTTERIEKQLKAGMKVEMEHTTDKNEARSIALQHLAERPDYYVRLKKVEEGTLHHWFKGSKSKDGKPGWVQADGSPCANEEGETKTPKCFSSDRLERLKSKGKKGENLIKSAVRRKREEDPGQQEKQSGAKPTMVNTFAKGKKNKNYVKAEPALSEAVKDIKSKGSGKKDACYHKVKSRFRVFPSAYASGALVRCRKAGADNWGNKNEEFSLEEGVRTTTQSGQLINIILNWRGKNIVTQLFFPQILVPKKQEVYSAVQKVYPDAKVISFRSSIINPQMPLIQMNKEGTESDLVDTILAEFKSPSWSRKEGKSETGGLNKKGIASYRRENPGSKLSLAVTTPPSKLKRGGKKWKRRKSFCARMSGVEGPLYKNGEPTRKKLSLDKWNC